MATTIKCDKCGNEIEITEAIRKELEQKVLEETKIKHQKELEEKDRELERTKEEIYEAARQEAGKKAEEEYKKKIKQMEEEASGIGKENEELNNQIKDLLKQLREEKNSKSKMEIEYQKKLIEEEGKIKEAARDEAEEELSFKMAEKDKKLSDAEKHIKDLQRRLQQGSQQMQGEIQEDMLEEILKKEFLYDEIKEVPKGIKGADVMQTVCNSSGASCGTIIWESKNTKNWSHSWIPKLKEDQRSLKAEVAVIVSKILPTGIKGFAFSDGVWISDINSTMGLACALRHQLIEVYSAHSANKGKANKAEIVYNYLISNEFKQRIEAWVEYFKNRREDLEKEKAYFTKKWAKEEKAIMGVVENTAGIYGDLQGLIGAALPKIQHLELPEDTEKG
jgi:hypothetical protein